MKQISVLILTFFYLGAFAQTADELFKSAELNIEKGDYKSSLKLIDKAIQLDSTNIDFYDTKADVLYHLEQYLECFDTYNQAIEIFPNKSHLYNNRGNLSLSFQEIDYAIQDFNTAMSLADSDSSKHYAITNRAVAKLSKRDFEGAYDDLIVAYNFDSTDIAVLSNLGAICDEIGKGDQTLMYLHKVLEIDSTFYPAYGNIGFKYQELGNYQKAIEYFNKVLEFDSEEPLAYSNRSYNKLKIGDMKGAMSDINKSIKLYPVNSYAYRTRALIHIENNDIDKACDDIQTALDLDFTLNYGEEVFNLRTEYCR